MCLASVAARLPALEDRPSLLQGLAHRRCVGAAKRGAAPALAGTAGEKPTTQCWDGRLTVGQDDQSERRSTRLRRWEEGSRQEASPARRYGRVGAQGQGPQR